MKQLLSEHPVRTSRVVSLLTIFLALIGLPGAGQAGLADRWIADDLAGLNDGDLVGSWVSANARVVSAGIGLQPLFKKNATPAGGPVVRFNQSFMTASDSPVGLATAFSIAVVFKASSLGAGSDSSSWYQCSGLVDAEQGGVTIDWGMVFNGAGHVGVGSGSPDTTTFSSGASLADGAFHIAVFTWGAGSQSVYIDSLSPVTRAGAGAAARMNAGFALGGILTGEGGAAQRFIGDIAEVRFYNTSLSSPEVVTLVQQLYDTHINGTMPVIRSFGAAPQSILIGAPVTLSWNVKANSDLVTISPAPGRVTSMTNSAQVYPRATTTYTLTASNAFGIRTATALVVVDQGIPVASNQTVSVAQDGSVAVTLRGSDPQGAAITFAVAGAPLHGSLSGTPPALTYTPAPGFYGNDQFTFTVSDGEFASPPAAVSIRVLAPPSPPVAITLSSTNVGLGVIPGSFVAAIRVVDPNPDDTQTITLSEGYGENAQFVIDGTHLMAGPSFVGGLGARFSIRLRSTDNTGLWLEQDFALRVVELTQPVVINEIHYNPPDNTRPEEYIELHNPASAPVDVSYWRLTGGVAFTMPAGTVIPGDGYLVVAADPAAILSRFGAASVGPWSGGLSSLGERVTLLDSLDKTVDEVNYASEFPWPIAANGGGGSMALVNAALDNDLGSSWRVETAPSPGAVNHVWATNAAPNIRQVRHTPATPASTNQVLITAKVTDPDGVASVQLLYQVVTPGAYIPSVLPLSVAQLNTLNSNPGLAPAPNPAFENPANWTAVAMTDDGTGGDAAAADGVYSVTLPPQNHRVLVRYRIVVTDALGATRRAPFEDDSSLNFAYYVYDGVPAYAGVSSAAMNSLPVYQLLTRAQDFSTAEAYNAADQMGQLTGAVANEGRFAFNWEGAFVYENEVYDHVRYRTQGANGRYQNGRRSFSIQYNDGRYLAAKDLEGKAYPQKWSRLNISKGQSNRQTVTHSLNEALAYFLMNKIGVPSPLTHYIHWRVVHTPAEQPSLYDGDFYGAFMIQENYDVRFLDTHNMAKGNLYKLINAPRGIPAGGAADMLGQLRYQGAQAVTNGMDAVNLQAKLTGAGTIHDTASLLAYVNYSNYYRYHSMMEAVRDYDFWPDANKNAAWYFEPVYGASNNFYGRMWTLPWDATDTFGPTWNAGQDLCYNGIFPVDAGYSGRDPAGGQNWAMQIDYFNTMRELRDLLIQPDQVNPVLDAFASNVAAIMPASLARWSNAPLAGSGYLSMALPGPGLTAGVPGYVQDLKNFLFVGGTYAWWLDRTTVNAGGWAAMRLDTRVADAALPAKPVITYGGLTNYPVTGLFFRSSAFSDPQGAGTFAAMQWRVAEASPSNNAAAFPSQVKLEWDAAWDSGELTVFTNQIQVPAVSVPPGKLYRARVRHKDNSGRWSSWSAPLAFTPSPVDLVSDLQRDLTVTEIMFHPPTRSGVDGDEFEFIELCNSGTTLLDLSGLYFTSGVTFTFPIGTLLQPGQYFVLGRSISRLQSKYPGLVVNGVYKGKLANGGDTLTLVHPYGARILSVSYGTRAPWPVAADGLGFSLVRDLTSPTGFCVSAQMGGAPGAADPVSTVPVVVVNELFTSAVAPEYDAVELFNPGSAAADVGGWYLTDDATYPWKYRIPDGTMLAAGHYLVFDERDFNPTPGLGASFSFSSLGEVVYLFSGNAARELTGYSHGFAFGGAARGESFGRYINSVGEEQFPPQSARTLGTNNAGPRVGPVVLSEIQYHPAPGGDVYVELLNISSSTVSFFDPANPTNTWRLSGLAFTFPSGVTLDSGARMLLVTIDPALFRGRYAVPDAVQIFGPVSGSLQNTGERLELLSPDLPSTNGVPYFTVDAVRYNDKEPWPVLADGLGAALRRVVPAAYGDDPANWTAVVPSPGGSGAPGTLPAIVTGPAARTEVAYTDISYTALAAGSAPLAYQWRFNGAGLPGATNATLLITNLQPSQAGAYSVWAYNPYGSVLSTSAVLTILMPAFIASQPLSVRTNAGSNVVFSVSATGTGALSYQWRLRGTNIPGATATSLLLTNVQLDQSGLYTVAVMDAISTTISQPAELIVLVKPVPNVPPPHFVSAVGESVVFTASAYGTLPMGARWRKNSGSFVDYVNLPGNVATLSLSNLVLTNAGAYTAVFTNYAAPSPTLAQESAKGQLLVVKPPLNQMAELGASATFRAPVNGQVLRYFAWEFNGAPLLRGTNPAGSTPVTNLFVVTNVQPEKAGVYTFLVTNALVYYVTNAGITTTNWMPLSAPRAFAATLGIGIQIDPPVIDADPTNRTVVAGTNAAFTVLASGGAPLRYQWYFNSTNLVSDATNASLVLSNVVGAQAGGYSVVVTNGGGMATSQVAQLTVLLPPSIDTQPADTVAPPGAVVVISATASGSGTLKYQWYKGAASLANETNTLLVIASAQSANAGGYQLVVTNIYGSVTSRVALLTIGVAPAFTLQPSGLTVAAGATAEFTADASGDAPLSWQWYRDGAALAGKTARILSIANVQPEQAGGYQVVVSNAVGSATSLVAVLVVGGAPEIVVQPTNTVVEPGAEARLVVTATGAGPLAFQWWFNSTNALPGATSALLVLPGVQSAQVGAYHATVTNVAGGAASSSAQLVLTTTDRDGDGAPDWAEWIAGTDPADASSYLKVDEIQAAEAGVTLRFMAVSNHTYSVLGRAAANSGAWTVVTNVAAAPGSREIQFTRPLPAPGGWFYRLATPRLP